MAATTAEGWDFKKINVFFFNFISSKLIVLLGTRLHFLKILELWTQLILYFFLLFFFYLKKRVNSLFYKKNDKNVVFHNVWVI